MITPARRALVVAKESYLAARSAKFLETQSWNCEIVEAATEADRERVRMLLAGNRFDLVLAQQRMSPYSATDLLEDVKRAKLVKAPAVVCLANDEQGHTDFIRNGGAGFKVLEPGDVNLHDAITVLLREADGYWNSSAVNRTKILQNIVNFENEDSFQTLVIRVMKELNFVGVRRTHGPTEKGKDIVCWEVNKLGRKEYVGVQVKLGGIDASGGRNSLTDLYRQSFEAFISPVAFSDEDEKYLDKFVIVASGRINELARDKLIDSIRTCHIQKPVYFLGGDELADVIVALCPTLATELGR